jgi:flavin-dependent dehydrogenase
VVLVDRARFPRSKPCAEYASPGTVALLERLGVDLDGGRRLRGMELVAPNGSRHLLQYGQRAEALSIQRAELDTRLLRLACEAGVDVREQHRADQPLLSAGAVRGVLVRDPVGRLTQLKAEVVVGADGLNSMLVRALGLRRRGVWPARLGLVAHLRGGAWPEEFGQMWVGLRSYVGVAPVADDLLTVGLVTALPHRRMGRAAEALFAKLQEFPGLRRRLAEGELADTVQGRGPLAHTVRATSGPGFFLVGDAAGFFDPFTGEGLFRALRGAELAAEAVHGLLNGDGHAVAAYEAARRRVFGPKERLTALIQVFVRVPALMNYAVARLQQRPLFAQQLGLVLGDLEPAETASQPGFLWSLLKP